MRRSELGGPRPVQVGPPQTTSIESVAPTQKVAAPTTVDVLEVGRANIRETFSAQTRDRGMPAYVKALGPLKATLIELSDKPGAHWMDAGAGLAGFAARGFLEYGVSSFERPEYRNGQTIEPKRLPPKQLALTLLDLDCKAEPTDRVRVLSGRFIEQIPQEELPKCDLITDVEGPFSYSTRPDLILSRYVGALKSDGKLLLGLGSTVNLNMPGRHSRVIGADGVARTYLEWLKNIPGLEVTPHVVTSADPEDRWETLSVEIRKLDGAKVEIPPLAVVRFDGGGPPRMILKDALRDLSTEKQKREQIETDSRAALAKSGSQLTTAQFLDAFRDGAFDQTLLGALSKGGSWRHVGALSPTTRAELADGKLAVSEKNPIGAKLSSWVNSEEKFDLSAVSVDDLQPGMNLSLITDQGEFSASARPDAVLRRYLSALRDDGEILITLGAHGVGPARNSRVMTRKDQNLGLMDWLETIPGLSVETKTRRGESFETDESYVRIRVKDRSAISIRTLEPLGALPPRGGGPSPIIFREDFSEPAPKPTLGDTMNGLALRAWKAMW